MVSDPEIITTPDRPYICIRALSKYDDLPSTITVGLGHVSMWLSAHPEAKPDIAIARYRRMTREGAAVDIGFTLAEPVVGDDQFHDGLLPGGRYAMIKHIGPYTDLHQAHAVLNDWRPDIARDVTQGPEGLDWSGLIDIYATNPKGEPDPAHFEAYVLQKLKD